MMLFLRLLIVLVVIVASDPQECLNDDNDAIECKTDLPDGDDMNEDQEMLTPEDVLWDEYDEEQCLRLARKGKCNSNPSTMLYGCSRTCLLETEDLLAYGYYIPSDEEEGQEACEDEYDCEGYASTESEPCIYEPEYMAACMKTCLYCMPTGFDEVEFDIGVPQVLGDDTAFIDKTIQIMEDTLAYMADEVMADEEYALVRRACRNRDELCSFWAATGACTNKHDEDAELDMALTCGPACQSCEMQDLRVRCPIPEDAVDALKKGDSNLLFERIVGEGVEKNNNYTVTVHSRPGPHPSAGEDVIIGGPWVVSIQNFLSNEECDHFIEMGREAGFRQSALQEETSENPEDFDPENLAYRTSYNTWCEDSCYENPISRRVIDRIANITGVPESNSEYLQLVKYVPGQYYMEHHDSTYTERWLPVGPRILTVFIYLNDVEEGGQTTLTSLKKGHPPLVVQPERGKVVIWPNVLNEDPGGIDERTFHEALPVLKGVKYGANAWLRLREYKNAPECF